MFSRRKVAALMAEFLGTGILAFVVLAVSRSQIGLPYFVGIAAGLTVLLFGVVLARDVQLNPAYTLALWTARRIKTLKMALFIAAQMLGGMSAYLLYKYFAEGGVVQPLPTEYKSTLLVAEALGAFVFSFAAAAALSRQTSQLVRNVATGAAYTVGVIAASVAAAGFINPAVALASNAWAWGTYVLGPVLGAIIGVNLYSLVFADRLPRAERKKARTEAVAAKADNDTRKKQNPEAIDVSPAKVADKPLAKVAKAEKSAKADKKSKSRKSKK